MIWDFYENTAENNYIKSVDAIENINIDVRNIHAFFPTTSSFFNRNYQT